MNYRILTATDIRILETRVREMLCEDAYWEPLGKPFNSRTDLGGFPTNVVCQAMINRSSRVSKDSLEHTKKRDNVAVATETTKKRKRKK